MNANLSVLPPANPDEIIRYHGREMSDRDVGGQSPADIAAFLRSAVGTTIVSLEPGDATHYTLLVSLTWREKKLESLIVGREVYVPGRGSELHAVRFYYPEPPGVVSYAVQSIDGANPWTNHFLSWWLGRLMKALWLDDEGDE